MTSNPADIGFLLESGNANMARAIATAQQVAASDAAVLLSGESGTGKHVLAVAIHGWSPRHAAPFVTVPRAALARHRSEAAPLAYLVDGWNAYGWLQAADGGTLFFEGVGDLPPAEQAKLIRFLDEHRFDVGDTDPAQTDVRVIAATSRDLERETGREHFRDDLFSRLSTITIRLPPLRERPEDLPKLTDHLLARLTARYQCGDVSIAPEVRKAFGRYWWPGNIRELESILERGVALSRGQTITIADLPERLFARPRNVAAGEISLPPLSLDALERQQIERAIGECATLQEAASRLGIAATTLWRKRKRYGLG
jgi:NtrC-family two-component system response regulator AlgB